MKKRSKISWLRYYRVKYYFDVNQVLTPEQRKQVQKDLAQALSE